MTSPAFHVFLSHSSADKPAVEELARRLKKDGLEPWLDKWNLIPGVAYQPAIEEALDQCECCAVFIGPSGFGLWQNEEMRAAIARRIEDRSRKFRVIPILLPGAERGKRSNLPSFLVAATWVEFRQSLDEADAFHRLLCGVRGAEPGVGPDGAIFEGQCPYRGLQFFDVEHAPFFHGRESLIEWLLDAVSPAKKAPTRFLAILGASGSGKSSLARAGLVARLKKDGLPGSSKWPIAICRPGSNPLESLAVALAKVGIVKSDPTAVLQLVGEMGRSDTALHLAVQLALPDDSTRAVVMIDQFEEIFTICTNDEFRKSFLCNLLHAALVPQGRTIIALTMRADFLGKCASYTELAAALSDHQILVGPMAEAELRQAIQRPAQIVGLELEPGLIDILVREVNDQPGALPLLQHTLLELWEGRDGRRLTTKTYRDIGGLMGALEKRANAMFDSLNIAEQDLCRRIFLRLTQPGEGSDDTKRRAPMEELLTTTGAATDLERLVQKLAGERLITTEGAGGNRNKIAFLEVSHEALIRHWSKLKQWIEKDRANLRTQRQLTEAAKQWHENGRPGGYLYTGTRLVIAQEWVKRNPREINVLEAHFLRASVRNRKLLLVVIGFALALIVILGLISAYKWYQADERERSTNEYAQKAETNATRALEKEQEAKQQLVLTYMNVAKYEIEKGNFSTGIFNYWQAYHADSNNGSIKWNARSLLASWSFHQGLPLIHDRSIDSVAFSPDGQTVLTGSYDGTARLWDAKTGQLKSEPLKHHGAITSIAFSPDGETVLTGGDDDMVRLWDTKTGRLKSEPLRHRSQVTAIAFSPDGQTVLTGSRDNTARLWDAVTGKLKVEPLKHGDAISSLAFSPDGQMVITGSRDKSAQLWESKTGLPKGKPLKHDDVVSAVAFRPDGQTVLTGSDDKTARLWDANTGQLKHELRKHNGPVRVVAFSPDGQTVLTGSSDMTARLWDANSGQPKREAFKHEGAVGVAAFSRDGQTVLTGSFDNSARLWEVDTGNSKFEPLKHEGVVTSVAFSPDGQTILTGSSDRTARLWNVAPRDRPNVKPPTHEVPLMLMAVSPDRRTTLTISNDTMARLGDVETQQFKGMPLMHNGRVRSLAFSPDGQTALTGSDDKSARLWDVNTGRLRIEPLKHKASVTLLAFSPDGQTVFTGSEDNTTRLWDANTGQPKVEPMKHDDSAVSVAFSPDGQTVLTGSYDKTARLWDAKTGHLKVEPIKHTGRVASVAFSPDGLTVLTGSSDKTARLWDAKTGQPKGEPFRHKRTVELVMFGSDGQTVFTATQNTTASVWEVVPPAQDEPERLRLSVEVRTGFYLDMHGYRARLTQAEWLERRGQLDKLGGFCDVRSWDDVSEKEKLELRTPPNKR